MNVTDILRPRGGISHGRSGRCWDPLDELGRVLLLEALHLVLDVLHRHLTAEVGGAGEVSARRVSQQSSCSCCRSLLGDLGDGDGTVRLRATGGEGRETDHEEVETREGHHVDGELSQVRVELTGIAGRW